MVEAFFTQMFSDFGLLGLFVAAIIGNASVFLPTPIDFIVLAAGAIAPGFWYALAIGIVGGTGAAIGEMTAYILGLLGVSAAERAKHHEFEKMKYVRERLDKSGMVFIALASLTPFPFDLVGIAAGIIKYPPKKFFIAALAGKLVRYILIALAGFYSWGIISTWFLI